jgi:hypothetical protein
MLVLTHWAIRFAVGLTKVNPEAAKKSCELEIYSLAPMRQQALQLV